MPKEECAGESEWKYLVGVGCSLISSAGSAAGLVIQKWAHNDQQQLPEDERYPECGGLILSPTWVCGFTLLVVSWHSPNVQALTLGQPDPLPSMGGPPTRGAF